MSVVREGKVTRSPQTEWFEMPRARHASSNRYWRCACRRGAHDASCPREAREVSWQRCHNNHVPKSRPPRNRSPHNLRPGRPSFARPVDVLPASAFSASSHVITASYPARAQATPGPSRRACAMLARGKEACRAGTGAGVGRQRRRELASHGGELFLNVSPRGSGTCPVLPSASAATKSVWYPSRCSRMRPSTPRQSGLVFERQKIVYEGGRHQATACRRAALVRACVCIRTPAQ